MVRKSDKKYQCMQCISSSTIVLFVQDVLPALLDYCLSVCEKTVSSANSGADNSPEYTDILELLVALCLHKVPPWRGVMEGNHLNTYQLDFAPVHRRCVNVLCSARCLNFFMWLSKTIEKY